MELPTIPEITLTPFQKEDRHNLVRFLNEELIARNTLAIPNPYTLEEADKWLAKVDEHFEQFGVETHWAVRHREEGLIGAIGNMFHNGQDSHADEIGYWLAAPFRGRGWMTAVVQEFCRHLHSAHGIIRVEANVFAHNPASGRVLEKAGFEREGFRRKAYLKNGEFIDAIVYGWLAPELDIN